MVFPSVPICFDTPNWPQQQQVIRDGGGSYQSNSHHQLPPLSPSVMGAEGGMGGASSIKSGLMTDRARIAKIPQPEMALKCPRCESTNTKFCYFNNYSLTQPRHLCKTCRRYWTRGGALRNVPVGGGCRRNKRSGSKGSRSKSPAAGPDNYRSVPAPTSCTSSDVMMNHFHPQHLLSQNQFGGSADLARLSFGAPSTGSDNEAEFEMNVGGFVEQYWRLQQHQFPGLYTFGQSEAETGMEPCQTGQTRSKAMAPVKMEDTHQGLDLSRNFLGISGGGGDDQNQYWLGGGANAWTELAGLTDSSSSTRHLL